MEAWGVALFVFMEEVSGFREDGSSFVVGKTEEDGLTAKRGLDDSWGEGRGESRKEGEGSEIIGRGDGEMVVFGVGRGEE